MKNHHKNNTTKIKKGAWFVSTRGSYLPIGWRGWLASTPFIAYLIFTLIYGLRQTSSVAQAILFIVPNFVAAAAIMTWIAKRVS